jgi:hypothetical protein
MKLAQAIALFLAIFILSPIMATEISLVDLVDNGDEFIISGDKKFDQFTYHATGDMPPAAGVNVIPITDVLGNYGIRFQGSFLDHYSSPGGSDVLISYRVTALEPNRLISDAHITGNPYAIGNAIMSVVETFIPTESEKAMSIHHIVPNGDVKRVDMVDFDGQYASLLVHKDISAITLDDDSVGLLSYVDQTFSTRTLVPEPSGVAFILIGLVLLSCSVRRFDR